MQTIRLLSTYNGFPPNSIITVEDAVATSLLAGGVGATTDLTGGTVRYRDVPAVGDLARRAVPAAMRVGPTERGQITVPPGVVLRVVADAIAAGTAAILTSAGVEISPRTLTNNSTLNFGPYAQDTTVSIKMTSGGVSTETVSGGALLAGSGRLVTAQLAAAQRSRMLCAVMGAGQTVANGQASQTYQLIHEVPVPFDGMRVVLMHADPTAVPGVTCCFASGPDYAGDKNGNALTWVNGTFGGNASGTLASGTAARPSVLASDMVAVSSVARTDGRPGYVGYVRVYFPNATTLPISLHQDGNYNEWAALTQEAWHASRATGDFVTTKTGYSGGARADSPIWGIEFLCRGNVVSTLMIGDSTFKGQGTSGVTLLTFAEIAARAKTMTDGVTTFASANAGYSGQTSAQYLTRLQDLVAAGVKPTAVVYEAFSPNDHAGTATGITQIAVDAEQGRVQTVLELCRTNSIVPILSTGLPAAVGKAWNETSDQKRRAFNDLLRTNYSRQAILVDLDAALTDGATPAALKTTYTADGLHPNNAGHAAQAVQFAQDVQARIQLAFT